MATLNATYKPAEGLWVVTIGDKVTYKGERLRDALEGARDRSATGKIIDIRV